MNAADWKKVIKASVDPERVKHFLDLLAGAAGKDVLQSVSLEQANYLAALFSGSEAMSTLLAANPDWLDLLAPEALRHPRRLQGFRGEVSGPVEKALTARSYSDAFSAVRRFKQREMLRVAARDLARLGSLTEIVGELSDVADVCLSAVWRICEQQLQERHGRPYHQDSFGKWRVTPGCVLGMGKLGGQELNYSSDVDVLIVYAEEGIVTKDDPSARKNPSATLKNHGYFKKLAEAFVEEVARLSAEGCLYRIDLRLRPEGDTGPLARSLSGYENYYAQWGQTWERMMLIKARNVAGDEALAAEFFEMVQPFRYPRSVSENALREIGAMKDRIENEVVKAGELERNVKLGRGGIREIEFVAQSLQLLHGGRQPFLQGRQTLPCLEKLVQYELLEAPQAKELAKAYVFLRDVEHRLQMESNLQTHTIPEDQDSQERLARLMGFKTLGEFETARKMHTDHVRRTFDKVLKSEKGGTEIIRSAFPRQFAGFEAKWREIMTAHRFRDPEKAFKVVREFVEGPGYVHVSPRTVSLAHGLLPRLFALCPQPGTPEPGVKEFSGRPPLSDPDRVAMRLDSFISAYGTRSMLFELWNSNPLILDLLLLLFDRSEFLAELAIRTPDLVDELVTGDRLRQRKTSAETLRDLRHGIEDRDQHAWVRRYHQAERMRIGLRDILGLADAEQSLVELSALADACLQYALEAVMRKHKLGKPPFVVIGLGKLGGLEIDYGSDLDILFVADSKARSLAKLVPLAVEIKDLLSTRTEHGTVFEIDARLRPDGEKGLLVNTLKAYEDYYRQRALLWEIQSLTRTRPIAGDMKVGEAFQRLAAALSNFQKPDLPLAAFSPDWKEKIHRMRMRIEKERTPAGKDALAIKTGAGGLVDAEFVAQALAMENGWQEANTLAALERAKAAGVLPEADRLLDGYRHLRRVEAILRRWSYEGEIVLPEDPAPYYRVSVRCGFASPEAFREALAGWRHGIRDAYRAVFNPVLNVID